MLRLTRTVIFHMLPMLLAFKPMAQEKVTYEKDIKPILQLHCTGCHRPGEVGPFSLLTYADVSFRAGFIQDVTSTRYMPPWRADTAFRHFKNENVLSENEIQLIRRWVEDGRLEGKAKRKQHIPEKQNSDSDSKLQYESIALSVKNAYQIPGDGKEQFRFFHVPINNKDTLYVESIRFIPGNRKLVHHSRVMADTSGLTAGIDGLSADDPRSYDYQLKPLADPFLFGWVPGNDRIKFPVGTTKKILPNTELILNIHYAPTPITESDSSSILLTYSKKPSEREIKTFTMIEDLISNKPFAIRANTQKTFYMTSSPLEEDMSVISIMPHMHLLGKSFKVFAVAPDGEGIPLINIPEWDFNWQMSYMYSKYVKLPKGTVIYAMGTYDNTKANPRNPYAIPRNVGLGWGTKDEMMNVVIYYVPYREGDELHTLD